MDRQQKRKKITADILLVDLDPKFTRLKIGYGEAFYYYDNQLWISETPLQDPTLVPIKNVNTKDNTLEFDAIYKKVDTHFTIKGIYNGSNTITSFIQFFNEKPFEIDKNYTDNVSIIIEEEKFSVGLKNANNNSFITIDYIKSFGNYLKVRFPEPSKRFKIKSCILENESLIIKCEGHNLYDESPITMNSLGFEYKWNFNIQPKFLELITSLLQAGLENQ